MNEEIKGIIKFPVWKVDGYFRQIYDQENHHILDIRGWRRLQYEQTKKGRVFNEYLGVKRSEMIADFVIEAINSHALTLARIEELEAEKAELLESFRIIDELLTGGAMIDQEIA